MSHEFPRIAREIILTLPVDVRISSVISTFTVPERPTNLMHIGRIVTLVGISIEDHRLLAFGDCAYPAFTRGVGAAAGVIYSIYPPNTILSTRIPKI